MYSTILNMNKICFCRWIENKIIWSGVGLKLAPFLLNNKKFFV